MEGAAEAGWEVGWEVGWEAEEMGAVVAERAAAERAAAARRSPGGWPCSQAAPPRAPRPAKARVSEETHLSSIWRSNAPP